MPLNHGLIDNLALYLPHLPPALVGLRIAHLSDLHVTAPRARHDRMIRQLSRIAIDLVIMTGDYMTNPGQEHAAAAVLTALCEQVRPRYGFVAVFGNHDSSALRGLVDDLPICWLHNDAFVHGQLPLRFVGFEHTDTVKPDAVATALAMADHHEKEEAAFEMLSPTPALRHGEAASPRGMKANVPATTAGASDQAISFSPDRVAMDTKAVGAPPLPTVQPRAIDPTERLNVFLAHSPTVLPTAADMGAHVLFAGHTHGGQMRLPTGKALHNSTDLPLHLTSGLLRHRNTLAVVCRGLGTNGLPLRLFCPPHIPIVTLRRGPMPGRFTDEIDNIAPW